MIAPDKIIREIQEEFKTLKSTLADEWRSPQWTKAVLTSLCCSGHRLGYTVWASKVDDQHKNGGEWLYDVTWCEADEKKFLKSVPMVAECEWGDLDKIEEDFQKLLLARAAVRVLIFEGKWLKGGSEAIANRLCNWVGAFEDRRKGDTYLLVAYEVNDGVWLFNYYNILVGDPGQPPILKRLSY